ncbi:uncharacterized protein LOC117293731 [Asterias rubens]|uniref:uncharacterized protein LOC117293731 n=1 Tax=Asterias rubens TaxID=7604 RepID=UPI00145540CB|nr:uncharacterized protein LOC117293731 [Asterias rubens]
MVFVCILIRTKTKVLKPWYGRSVLDAKISFTDVFVSFASGVFEEGDPIGDQYETTQCGECLKWRVCYAARVLKSEQRRQLERELELLAFSCGTCFQDVSTDGDEESVFNVVYVNDKLTCDLPIEAPYYVTFDDPLCFFCGSEHDLITGDGNYPLCNECRDAGKKPHKKNTWAFNPRPQ